MDLLPLELIVVIASNLGELWVTITCPLLEKACEIGRDCYCKHCSRMCFDSQECGDDCDKCRDYNTDRLYISSGIENVLTLKSVCKSFYSEISKVVPVLPFGIDLEKFSPKCGSIMKLDQFLNEWARFNRKVRKIHPLRLPPRPLKFSLKRLIEVNLQDIISKLVENSPAAIAGGRFELAFTTGGPILQPLNCS
jgi:hypothetical protein